MDNAGLTNKFKVDRELTEDEKKHKLEQKKRLDIEPHYQLSVIKLNSTFLESIDKWYGSKGNITGIVLASMLILGISGALIIINWTLKGLGIIPTIGTESNLLVYATILSSILIIIFSGLIFFLKKESFAYTHYPTRFNRITRKVHVFPPQGIPFSASWNDIFFTIAQVDPVHKFWNVFGHVLDDSGKVMKTFALSVSETGDSQGILLLKSHWEFIRRYMEEGPQSVIGQVQFCLPISEKRESFSFGVHRLLANSSTASPVLVPMIWLSMFFSMITVPFRYFSIQTSKIPKWPENIENENRIIEGDAFAIEGDSKGNRIALYQNSATAAGVKFEAPPNNPLHS